MSSTSFPASADSALALNGPECEPSRSVRSARGAAANSPASGQASPPLTTYEPSPVRPSAQWTLFAAGSLARTSARPAEGLTLMEREAVSGANTPELLAKFDPASSSWRTSQHCLISGWEEFSGTWPRSGTMRSGIAFQAPPLVPLISASASGLLPTPQAIDAKGSCAKLSHKRWTTYHLKHWVHGTGLAIHSRTGASSWINPNFAEWMMGFPRRWTSGHDYTPTATAFSRKSLKQSDARS